MVRWPLQLQPPFGPSVDSLCHPCIATTHLSYSVLSLKLPPPPCAALLVNICNICNILVEHSRRTRPTGWRWFCLTDFGTSPLWQGNSRCCQMTQPRFEHLRKYHKILDPQVLSFAALPSKEFIGTFLLIFTVECNVVVSWHILLDKQLPLFRSFGFLCLASTRQSFRGRLPSFRRPLDWHGPLCGNPGPACEAFGDGICTSRVHISFCASWHRNYCTSLREGDLSSSHPSLVHTFFLWNPSYPFLPQKMQHPDRSRPSCRLAGLGQALGGISGGNFNPAVSVALGCVNSMKGPGMDWKQAGSVHSEPWNDIEHHDYDASSESCAYLQCDDLSIFTVSFIKLTVSFRPVFRLHAVHSASTRAVVKTWSGGHVLHLAGTIPG